MNKRYAPNLKWNGGLVEYRYIHFLYCSFCHFSFYSDRCSCSYDDYKFTFEVDDGLYCCQTMEEQCTSQYSDITDVTCTGEVLNLTQQCHNECNFYGFDADRNYYFLDTVRSYLNICQDNRYEFKLKFPSILQRVQCVSLFLYLPPH